METSETKNKEEKRVPGGMGHIITPETATLAEKMHEFSDRPGPETVVSGSKVEILVERRQHDESDVPSWTLKYPEFAFAWPDNGQFAGSIDEVLRRQITINSEKVFMWAPVNLQSPFAKHLKESDLFEGCHVKKHSAGLVEFLAYTRKEWREAWDAQVSADSYARRNPQRKWDKMASADASQESLSGMHQFAGEGCEIADGSPA